MNKSLALQIRVSPRQKAELERLAEHAGTSISAFVLERAIPSSSERFSRLIADLQRTENQSALFAELHDLIARLKVREIESLPSPLVHLFDSMVLNYIAALVEMAAQDIGAHCPAWVSNISPSPTPEFGSQLSSLRGYILVHAHPCFKRRNLFYDSGLHERV